MKQQKLIDICYDIYRELYKNSTPSADFDTLVKNATLNERGEKEIPYLNYEIDPNLFNKILTDTLRKYKLTKIDKRQIHETIYLGCSPKFKL